MALYTIVFDFRGRNYAFQVEEQSAINAIRKWIAELETDHITHFGNLSRRRLEDQLQRTGINQVPGLKGVYDWLAPVSSYSTHLYIIETCS